jgi:putative ABC transport system substrate-binding protein
VTAYTLTDGESSEDEILRGVAKSRAKLILAVGSPALRFAVDKFTNIPVVFSVVVDPSGVVGDERSVRGATLQVAPKTQFETLLQIAPRVKRVGVVHDPSKTGPLIEEAANDARELGLELISREVSSTADVAAAWKEIQDSIDAIWMVPDTTAVTDQSFQYMLTISSKRNLPLLAISGKYVSKGALFALSADYRDVGRQAGEIANSVLRGADPGRVRSTTARSPKLVLNLRTAELMGLSVPKEVTEKAAHVYD